MGISAESGEWGPRLTRSIAAEVKRLRNLRHWSAQRLSDECARLGYDFPRSTLADLEAGRRAHISVAELLVLARALGIPPLLLIFPVGTTGESEVLPGESRAVFRAAQWFTGEGPYPDPEDADMATLTDPRSPGPAQPLALYRANDEAFGEEMRAMARAKAMEERAAAAGTGAEREAFSSAADAQRRAAEGYREGAGRLREQAAALGITPPGLIMGLRIISPDPVPGRSEP